MKAAEGPELDGALRALLAAQRRAVLDEGVAPRAIRADRLARAIDILVSHQARWVEAAASDFGQRPAAITRFMDIMPAVRALKLARRRLRWWLRPRRQRLGLPGGAPGSLGAVLYQPLGVIGVISPWNFPINLSFSPLAGILAAGNRCLLKPSELTPALSGLMQELVRQRFDELELAVITGDARTAAAFSRLPFDHLLYTGSGTVGRQVMAAAAENLVPVTLELGGKCPALIGQSARLPAAVDHILLGKLANTGQMCVAPDYVCLPNSQVDAFVSAARSWVNRAYPRLASNRDYTHLLGARAMARMSALLEDASAKGARLVPLAEAGATPPGTALQVPTLVLGVRDDMLIMQQEIFGPLLPVIGYAGLEEALSLINGRARPLALYYFGRDRREQRRVLEHTRSGGVTINGVGMHVLAEELPFGGVGASGMGAYHGEQGFRTFSHARALVRHTRLDVAGLIGLRPPYGRRLERVLDLLIRR